MQCLLDTPVLLWWLGDSSQLSSKAKKCIIDGENDIYLSSVSIWEMRVKESLGKLSMPKKLLAVVQKQGILSLEMTWGHADAVKTLPYHHKDPFDRLLVAQAQVEGLSIVTKDEMIKKYGVATIW